MSWTVPDSYEEAVEWFRGKLEMTREEWDQLSERAKRKAFTVSQVASADIIHDVWQAVDRAIAKGLTLAEFKTAVTARLEIAWQGDVSNPAWRVETIFRTNVQSAYASGRYRQLTEPSVLKVRPFWMFDAIMDDRTTPVCEHSHGVVLAADDPWWATHNPPMHFNCRSGVRALRESQAKGRVGKPPSDDAAPGFGLRPDESEWTPDVSKYPDEIDLGTRLQ